MKVFVTGASGFVGSAIVKDLIAHGHDVLGLARSEKSAQKITELGAEVFMGDLLNFEGLKEVTQKVDAVIHTAFNHDFTRFKASCEEEKPVLLAFGEALKGTDKPFVITGAAGSVADGDLITEETRLPNSYNPRIVSENTAEALATEGILVSIIRLPPSVHGTGDIGGFIPMLINIAKGHGKFAYVEGLENAWCAVHCSDAAAVYRLALEKNTVPGKRFNAIAESEVAFKEIAKHLSKKIGLPLEALSKEDAESYFDGFTHFATANIITSSTQTQTELDWKPKQGTLFEDINNGIYG